MKVKKMQSHEGKGERREGRTARAVPITLAPPTQGSLIAVLLLVSSVTSAFAILTPLADGTAEANTGKTTAIIRKYMIIFLNIILWRRCRGTALLKNTAFQLAYAFHLGVLIEKAGEF